MLQVIIQPCCEGLVLKHQPGNWVVHTHTCKGVEEEGEAAGTVTFCKDAPRPPSPKKVAWAAMVAPKLAAVYSEVPFPTGPRS